MKLYHGTAEKHIPKILKQGIHPRGKKVGNWRHTVESNPKCVYLTSAYPLHFAGAAVDEGERLAVIEVDTSKLHILDLLPDEDYLEQATRNVTGEHMAPTDKSMVYRTRWYRRRAHGFQHYWLNSVNHMGTCCHWGYIPVRALTRVAFISQETYGRLIIHGCDPIISVMNFQICAAKYRNYVRWLFDEPMEPDPMHRIELGPPRFPSREGVEVITLGGNDALDDA